MKLLHMVLAGFLCSALQVTTEAQVRLSKEEALSIQFPGAGVERETTFLTDEQQHEIQRTSRSKVESKLLTYYVARTQGRLDGVAFFETHTVRTMPATYMVVIDPDTSVRIVEVLAFHEPADYRPPERWLKQYRGRTMGDDLYLKRGIPNIAGATLSAHTISEGVRRILASYAVAVAHEVQR